MSDSDYLNKTGIHELQEQFEERDGGTAFTNILDRGYHATQAACNLEMTTVCFTTHVCLE